MNKYFKFMLHAQELDCLISIMSSYLGKLIATVRMFETR